VRVGRQIYVITVTGEMDAALRERFEDVEVTAEHGVTRLRVVSPDPSVLHGVLHRIDALGLELLDVRPIDEMPSGDQDHRPGSSRSPARR
jgi:hypothetical protein